MTRTDKMILTGAWAAMAAVGAFACWKVSESPKIDPTIEKLCRELSDLERSRQPRLPLPAPAPAPSHDFDRVGAGGLAYMAPKADVFLTKAVGTGVDHPRVQVFILPYPVLVDSKASLDGVSIRWSTVGKEIPLRPWMDRNAAAVTGFLVHRQQGSGPEELIAELPPTASTYMDVSVEPRKAYRYWVTLKGQQSVLALDPPVLAPVSHRSDTPATEVVPSNVRMTLVGGDVSSAILKAEFYDRQKKAWIPKTRIVAPGAPVPDTGWTLKALRFHDFTLAADLTDDGGVDRVLTTKN